MIGVNWENPYNVKPIGSLIFKSYQVTFEDTVIIESTSRESADRMAAALNGAYNLGASSVLLEQATRTKENGNI